MKTSKIAHVLMICFILTGFWGFGLSEAAGKASTIRYVSPGGSDSGGCANRDLPCGTIQYAVDHSISGDEVRLASGVYTVTVAPVADIPIALTLRGGYSTTNWDVSNKLTNPTTLNVSCAWDSGEAAIDAGAGRVSIQDLDISGCGILSAGELIVERVSILNGGIAQFAPANIPVTLVDVSIDGGGFTHGSQANSMATLTHITISNSPGEGISEISAGGLVLSDAQISNCTGIGIRFANAAVPSHVSQVLVQGNGVGVLQTGGGTVTLDQVVIRNNLGRGVINNGRIVMNHVTIEGNHAIRDEENDDNGDGAGYYTKGYASTLTDVVIRENIAEGHGGGIYDISGGLKLIRTTVADNQAGQTGGGIWSSAIPTISQSAITGNQAATNGGGLVCHSCFLNLTNSTVSNNSATTGYGGGLSNEGGALAILLNSTFSGNSAVTGGGVSAWYEPEHPVPSTTIRNTIIANSLAGGDCFNDGDHAADMNGGSNLIETTSTCNSIATITSDPNLGSLTGSPVYFPLNPGSPAIDAGDNAFCAIIDQRGVVRPQDGDGNGSAVCDIGAMEVGFNRFVFLPLVVR